jgi:hypothetical protein
MKADNDNGPRLMTRAQAAAYCGCGLSSFSRWVAVGIMPGPVAGTRRWDRLAIDAMIGKVGAAVAEPESAFLKWKRRSGARAA